MFAKQQDTHRARSRAAQETPRTGCRRVSQGQEARGLRPSARSSDFPRGRGRRGAGVWRGRTWTECVSRGSHPAPSPHSIPLTRLKALRWARGPGWAGWGPVRGLRLLMEYSFSLRPRLLRQGGVSLGLRGRHRRACLRTVPAERETDIRTERVTGDTLG